MLLQEVLPTELSPQPLVILFLTVDRTVAKLVTVASPLNLL